MTGLEIPAFVIGASGIATAFDKAFSIWKAIAQARDFGEDMAEWLYRLEFEFFKFQTWWVQLQHASTNEASYPQAQSGASDAHRDNDDKSIVSQLRKESLRPIENAVVSIAELLRSIESILQRYDILRATSQRTEPPAGQTPTADLSRTLLLIGSGTNRGFAHEVARHQGRKPAWRVKHQGAGE